MGLDNLCLTAVELMTLETRKGLTNQGWVTVKNKIHRLTDDSSVSLGVTVCVCDHVALKQIGGLCPPSPNSSWIGSSKPMNPKRIKQIWKMDRRMEVSSLRNVNVDEYR